MKLIAYARVSTEDQGTEGQSIEEQLDRIRQFCAAMGHELVGESTDIGVSGSVHLASRPEGASVSNALTCKWEGCEGVIVYDLSRLTRSIEDMVSLMSRSDSEGWALISMKESVDTKTPSGRLMVHVMASFNQFLRENISVRTKDALARRRAQGRSHGDLPPWGYSKTGHGYLTPNPLERRAVDFAYVSSSSPPSVVAKAFNKGRVDINLKLNPRSGVRWSPADVKSLRRSKPYWVRDAEINGDTAAVAWHESQHTATGKWQAP